MMPQGVLEMSIQIIRITDPKSSFIDKLLKSGGMPYEVIKPKFVENDNNILLVAMLNTEICGFLYAYFLERIDGDKPMLFLYSIDVFPDFQRKGIATKLISKLKEIAKSHNCCEIFVMTNERNEAAMRLYRKTGGRRGDADDVLFTYEI